jgi:hypothetical protein
LFEVPFADYNWSGGGFRIDFSSLKEIKINEEASYKDVIVRLYEA